MAAYYNENDAFAAQWLRNLVSAGHIAAGEVDQRDIREVRADDLQGFTQCHFFAGVGVWSYALRLAGWADDRPVWTGSCPCQPFSLAGNHLGANDERHLWPVWFDLIQQCRPTTVFGEQVEGAVRHGWLDAVCSDMEGEGYAIGAAVFGAHSVGAPHIRQRLWFVGVTASIGWEGQRQKPKHNLALSPGQTPGGLAHTRGGQFPQSQRRSEGRDGNGSIGENLTAGAGRSSPSYGLWRNSDWLLCRDGKWRAVEPGTFPLAHGASSRVGRLRAYGNAICAPVAAEFIMAFDEAVN
jgi:DNA (cytosine-5)-methyltransferase 1